MFQFFLLAELYGLTKTSRLECIQGLDSEFEISNRHKMIDVLHFFHGDNLSVQLEAGKQNEGNYFCPICPIKARHINSLLILVSADVETLQMKQKKIKMVEYHQLI